MHRITLDGPHPHLVKVVVVVCKLDDWGQVGVADWQVGLEGVRRQCVHLEAAQCGACAGCHRSRADNSGWHAGRLRYRRVGQSQAVGLALGDQHPGRRLRTDAWLCRSHRLCRRYRLWRGHGLRGGHRLGCGSRLCTGRRFLRSRRLSSGRRLLSCRRFCSSHSFGSGRRLCCSHGFRTGHGLRSGQHSCGLYGPARCCCRRCCHCCRCACGVECGCRGLRGIRWLHGIVSSWCHGGRRHWRWRLQSAQVEQAARQHGWVLEPCRVAVGVRSAASTAEGLHSAPWCTTQLPKVQAEPGAHQMRLPSAGPCPVPPPPAVARHRRAGPLGQALAARPPRQHPQGGRRASRAAAQCAPPACGLPAAHQGRGPAREALHRVRCIVGGC